MTPTIVYGSLSITTDRPITPGSPPNSRVQMPYPSTSTLSRSAVNSSRVKVRPRNGARAENLEEPFGHQPGRHALGTIGLRVRAAPRFNGRDRERIGRALAPVHEIGRRDIVALRGPRDVVLAQLDELVLIRIRQRPQQHGLDRAEDRHVGADAEAERQDDDQGEAGLAHERPERVAEIRAEVVPQLDADAAAHVVLVHFHAAEVAQRRASRFVVRHASSHARFDLAIEMVAQLGVQVIFQARTARDAAPARPKLGEDRMSRARSARL